MNAKAPIASSRTRQTLRGARDRGACGTAISMSDSYAAVSMEDITSSPR